MYQSLKESGFCHSAFLFGSNLVNQTASAAEEESRSKPFSPLTSVMSIAIVGCCIRVAPPLRVLGVRVQRDKGQLVSSFSRSAGLLPRETEEARSRREGGGRRQESRRTDPTTSSQRTGWPQHVLQPKALHPLLSHRHFEPDGGQLPEVWRYGSRRGESRVPAGRLPAAASLPARYAASAAGAAASSSPPSPSPPSPVLLLFILILLLFLSLGHRSSSRRRSGTRRALSCAPRGAAVLRGRRRILQRRHRERRRPAVLPGHGEERRGGSGVVQQPGAQIPDK